MVRLLSDENLHGNVIRGLRNHHPEIDLVRDQDVGLEGAEDPVILEWAAEQNRIVLTSDKATMPAFAFERLSKGEPMPGMFVVDMQSPIRVTLDEILLIDDASDQLDWAGLVVYLPL